MPSSSSIWRGTSPFYPRLRSLDDTDPEKAQHRIYLDQEWRIKWILIGMVMLVITGLWLHFPWTRDALLYGASLWAVCYVFRGPLLRLFEKVKSRMFHPLSSKEE